MEDYLLDATGPRLPGWEPEDYANAHINTRSIARLGKAIKQLRARRGITQADLAARAGVSRVWLSQLESGAKDNAELAPIMRILDELHVTLMVRAEDTES